MATKKYPVSTIGFKGFCDGPADVETYESTGANVVEDGVAACLAWDHYPNKLQPAICKLLEKHTGIARGVDTKATEAARKTKPDAKEVDEKPTTYAKRVLAGLDDATKVTLNSFIQTEVFDKNPVDTAPGSRRTVAGKEATEKAEEILGRDTAAIEIAVAKLMENAPGYVLDRDDAGAPTETSLAMLIRTAWDNVKKAVTSL